MTVRIEDKGGIFVIHNHAEKRGAITPELYQSITEAIKLAYQTRVRCIILTGGAFFCAGGDLGGLKRNAKLPVEQRRAKIDLLHNTIMTMQNSQVPLIAAIEGGAVGAGLSLALACDMIVAAQGAKFTAAYVKAGLTPDGGLTHALDHLVPRQLSMEMCLFGHSIPVERFAELGVVSRICPQGQALDTALLFAQPLLTGSQQAQSRIRKLVAHASQVNLAAQLDLEAMTIAEAQGSTEAAEGISAFLEKRKPKFKS